MLRIFGKNYREKLNTKIALAALVLSIVSIGLSQFQYWSGLQGNFRIEVEREFQGPVEIVTIAGHKCIEGFIKLIITNQSGRAISITRVSVCMLNRGRNSGLYPPSLKKIAFNDREVGLVAFHMPFYGKINRKTFPVHYFQEIETPFSIAPYEQKAIYIRISSVLLESPEIIEEVEKLLSEDKGITWGQFIVKSYNNKYGKPVRHNSKDIYWGPDWTTNEIIVLSSDGIIKTKMVELFTEEDLDEYFQYHPSR